MRRDDFYKVTFVPHQNVYVVRDSGGHIVTNADNLTESQALALAETLNERDYQEKLAQEARIAEHQRQKAEAAQWEKKSAERQRLLQAAGSHARKVQRDLDDALATCRNMRAQIETWRLNIQTTEPQLTAVNAQVNILQREMSRLLREQQSQEEKANV